MKYILFVYLFLLDGCRNQYKEYGIEMPFNRERYKYEDKGAFKKISIEFKEDEFRISDREIVFRLDTSVIYIGPFFESSKLVEVPVSFFNKSPIPNLTIIEPNGDKAYYFESKDSFHLGDTVKTYK